MLLLQTAFAADWTLLQTEQVRVRCREVPPRYACEATSSLSSSPTDIRASIEDIDHYSTRFESMSSATLEDDGSVRLHFDLPFFLGDWTTTSTPRSWHDLTGWHLGLVVKEASGRTPLFEELVFDVLPEGDHTQLTIRWTHDLGWPAPIRDRITRQQGHNLVWGIALGANTKPTTPIAGPLPMR